MSPKIDIDENSGFCFGVTTAITTAERELASGSELYCLGDIVHNSAEIQRLAQQGLQTVTVSELPSIKGSKVLLRAHGEPPSTYKLARQNNITVVDATCPVVLKLQQRIKKEYDDAKAANKDVQIVIYGQTGHAEVNGLVGQTEGTAIVIEGTSQLDRVDMTRDIALYSQTTKSPEGFREIIRQIEEKKSDNVNFTFYDTICRQVANRVNLLRDFASSHDVVLFVAGEKSSNGKVLLGHCRTVNPKTFMLASAEDIKKEWLDRATTVGICGATSTPRWLMEKVAEKVTAITEKDEKFHCN